MISTLAQRCHSANLISEIDSLSEEINTFYAAGQITYILGLQLTKELIKRARVVLNITYPISFPITDPPLDTSYLSLEDGLSNFQLEAGSDFLKLES